MKGKAYAHSKKSERNENDFYSTPKSLVWVAEDIIKREFKESEIIEPACGLGAISEELQKYNFYTIATDLYHENEYIKHDYLSIDYEYTGQVITNPPFSLWDEFVLKAKTHCKKFMFIGRLNYLGTNSRYQNDIWKNLKAVYPFNRYVDYQTPYREDGLFHVGAMATAWFLWDMEFEGKPTMEILDVQEYAKLGAFKK